MSRVSNSTSAPLVFRRFEDFENLTGILYQLKHIAELQALGLKLSPDTDGSYRPQKAVLDYLRSFCSKNPAYHIISETHYSDKISEDLGSERKNWIVRTFVNYGANIKYTRRYYLADGCADQMVSLIEMLPIANTNIIPFRRN